MIWRDKAWGQTRCLWLGAEASEHQLKVNEGGFCSFHYHKERANYFRVTYGLVRVIWTIGWQIFHKDLTADEPTLVIPALICHQFQVIESGEMYEVYRPDRGADRVREDDIERLCQGDAIDRGSKFLHPVCVWHSGDKHWIPSL